MDIEELKTKYANDPQVAKISNLLEVQENCRVQIQGLCGSADAFIGSSVVNTYNHPHIFVLSDKEEAAYFLNDLEALTPKGKVFFFPASARTPYAPEQRDNANILMRAEALNALLKNVTPPLIVTYPEALAEKVVAKKHLEQNTLSLGKGEKISIDFLNELLFEYEFERVDFVVEPGQFSIRGGIVDVFSFSNDFPYRIEFFGDEVDSMRTFDPATQLSIRHHTKLSIIPNVQEKILREFRDTFLSFLPKEAAIWMKDYHLICEKIKAEYEKAQSAFIKLEETVQLAPKELFSDDTAFQQQVTGFSVVEFGSQFHFTGADKVSFDMIPQPSFRKNFELLTADFEKTVKSGGANLILSRNAKQIERLYTIFEDIGKDVNFTPILISIHEGFVDRNNKLACYTDHQIFERYHRFHLKDGFNESKKAITLKELTDLQPGDYVTHIDHGVGQFAGLKKIDVNGKMQEAIKLIYKDNDIVFVSIHSLHRIAKYSGKEGTKPKINKLGSKVWQSLKQKTKKKVKEIAYDLIKLYAERKSKLGFAFTPDTYLQHELEASFIYEDTPDQFKATKAVKEDMELTAPMDRLVCGDVGFGKTEIAIRAAFKAVTDGKQVAVLAPTTILTLQHYKTFRKRLVDFPCTVDYINRFKTGKQQKETLKNLAEGKTDIIIGTHRLVGKDVKFKDIGLLIIDEEQKFGVSVKDKLKMFKTNVDTLTLTATPIPRTLQFSLMGARDLSIINTPPPNRQPVQTELHAFNESIIKEAIYYEIARDGQVFFVHNRVQNIGEVAEMIRRLCPEARVEFAHGQMDGPELEDVMMRFIEGDFDVLVSTTIIESGLDIPNANTIIINQAHMFGMSDVHQMRGRVGRSNKKAFCYLLSPPISTLTDDARKRLQAVEQFSELGSGFNIAMRDLDIRGAGDLLGAEQSGFISEIGFDMYHKILEEAIQELKENEFKDIFHQEEQKIFLKDCQVDTDLEVMIPDDYVNNFTERLSLYKTLASITTEEELEEFETQLNDRFGPVPYQVIRLFSTMRLKWIARDIGFEKLILKNQRFICYFISDQDSPYYQSTSFMAVLDYMKTAHQIATMKEKNDKLILSFNGVKNIPEAIALLEPILEFQQSFAQN